jgi:hypothetical protein
MHIYIKLVTETVATSCLLTALVTVEYRVDFRVDVFLITSEFCNSKIMGLKTVRKGRLILCHR